MALDPNGSKVGTLVAAAMETNGAMLQSQFLDLFKNPSGEANFMLLAGLLYLLSITSAIIILAIGGNYKWGRYLLVGPPIFFFLTQIRTASNGAEWQFGAENYGKEAVERALRGVNESENGNGGDANVSLFYQFWNIFMTDITQELLKLLRLTEDGSNHDFLTKVERYMGFWLNSTILDQNLRVFVKIALTNHCADYYMMLRSLHDPHVDDVAKEEWRGRIAKREFEKVFQLRAATETENEVHWWLTSQAKPPMEPGMYTCQELWEGAVKILRGTTKEVIERELNRGLVAEQDAKDVVDKFLRKVGLTTGRANGQVEVKDGTELEAIDWVLARMLWQEIGEKSPYFEYMDKEGHGGYFAATAPNGAFSQRTSGSSTKSAIRQFNRTETHQFKGDFVNGALSLPYFQGLVLMILSATFPFFAMMAVIPGRAGSVLMWMGLWAWAKLWDFGFGVVMMIDNMLYTFLPRGPNLAPGDIDNAGRAWARLLEQDPAFNSTTYYNIIATCMYAVPVATGVFVKGGGRELMNLIHGGWTNYSSRLGGSAVSFARSLQAQSYVANQRRTEFGIVARALQEVTNDEGTRNQMLGFVAAHMGTEAAGQVNSWLSQEGKDKTNALSKMLADGGSAVLGAVKDQKRRAALTAIAAYAKTQEYNHAVSNEAMWASESGHAAKYYSHDTAANMFSGVADSLVQAQIASNYFSQEKSIGGFIDASANAGMQFTDSTVKNALKGGK